MIGSHDIGGLVAMEAADTEILLLVTKAPILN